VAEPRLDAPQPAHSFAELPREKPVLGSFEPGDSSSIRFTTEIVTDIEGIRALRPDYEHLNLVSGNTLPFALHEWHSAWCDHFLNRHEKIEDQPLFCIVRDPTRECVGIVPLISTRRKLGPLKLVTVGLIGADPGLTEIRGPLIKPGYEQPTLQAVRHALARVPDWDWIEWNGLNEEAAAALDRETEAQWCEVSEDYVLDLPSNWEQFRTQLGRNVRESLRHCYNSLKRDGHAFEFVVAREREEVRQALGRFFALHRMRATMAHGPKHPDRFAGRALQTFFYDVCDRLAARDAVRIFQLRIAGAIVASRVGFLTRDSVYLYYSGFDPAWGRYSVMTTTLAEALKYSIADGIKTANLSLYTERSKLRWRPRRVEFRSALISREPLRSRAACTAYRWVRSSDATTARLLKGLWFHRQWN